MARTKCLYQFDSYVTPVKQHPAVYRVAWHPVSGSALSGSTYSIFLQLKHFTTDQTVCQREMTGLPA